MSSPTTPLIGLLTHQLIAHILALGLVRSGAPLAPELESEARRLVKLHAMGLPVSATLAVATAANVYLRRCLPGDWRFVGAEVPVAGGRVDLVHERPGDQGVVFDEIKAVSLLSTPLPVRVGRALETYRVAGLARFGARFIGVRIVCVRAPRRSLFLSPDGVLSPLASSPLCESIR